VDGNVSGQKGELEIKPRRQGGRAWRGSEITLKVVELKSALLQVINKNNLF
jgi:hypothetical protein